MSLDDKAEQAAYDALVKIAQIPRPKERQRICLNIMHAAAKIIGAEVMEVKDADPA